MNDRPFLQIPIPSEEEHRLYEEWMERKRKDEKEKDDSEERVIIIDV